MKSPRYLSILAAALALCSGPLRSEDIDLFVNSPSGAGLPNVLFIVDNTANWNTAFDNEMSVLESIFLDLPTNDDGSAKFNIGIMFAAETGGGNNNNTGGYVRAALRPMTDANKTAYAAMIGALDKLTDRSNGGASSLIMAEAYRYLSQGAPITGNGKVKTDYAGNTASGWSASATTPASKTAMQAIYALPGNALNGFNGSPYNPPIAEDCAKNFIIYISNGPPQDNNSRTTLARTTLIADGGDATQISLSPSGSQTNVSDEWARFMHEVSPLKVATYTIDVDPVTTGQGPGWTRLLQSMAEKGGGISQYSAVSSSANAGEEIKNAVNDALADIQAVNSVFASVSLPVSVNTQGTYLNQVFVGMFRPDGDALPRWHGNLKQYKLGMINGELRLLDADEAGAINNQTGFLRDCARSYWSSTNTYWAFLDDPPGDCSDATKPSDSPDGSVVEKGAQGQMLRSLLNPANRSLKTCAPTFNLCTTLTNFDASNTDITEGLLGADDIFERSDLINWARGYDIDDENSNTVNNDMRASSHGDVVHSRPVAINYGDAANPQVVVFYGTNDGVFKAINGNRSPAIAPAIDLVAPGHEIWAFMPPEFYGNIKRLRESDIENPDAVKVSFPNVSGTTLPKPYGVDGAITAHQDGSTAWIFAGMRRGGRALYAFNVSNPASISLKWKVGCGDNFPVTGAVSDANCSSGFTGIGQTWSAAKVFKASGYGSGALPMLIMGGGYDPCEDANPNTCSTTKGNQIFVLDADTGALLNTFATDRAVAADVVVVPDANGLAKYAYAVDMGGNIYRLTMGDNVAPSSWTMVKIASLGCDTTAACTDNRKFLFAPDILADGNGYIVLLGSGDREKPLEIDNEVDNYFFTVKDQPTDADWLSDETGTCGSGVMCLNSLLAITTGTPDATDLAAKKGTYLALQPTEQVVTSAITIFGVVTFSTHSPTLPDIDSCASDLGTARVYNILHSNSAPADGVNRYEELPSDIGLPPSPVAGMVTLDSGETVPFCIGCNSASPLEGEEPEIPAAGIPGQSKRRIYWYIER
jgi:type IV pilus assembly protein PilY1